MTLPARLSIVTLGVADLARSIAFYEALGWQRKSASIEGAIAWFGTANSTIGLFPWDELAHDANLPPEPRAPFGGITLAINVESPEAVTAGTGRGGHRGWHDPEAGDAGRLGRNLGLFRRSGRPPLGDRPQPGFPDRRGRARPHPLTTGGPTPLRGERHQRTVTWTAPGESGANRRKASL